MLVIGEDTSDADQLAVGLAAGQPDPTPWLTAIDAPLAARSPGRTTAGGREAIVDGPDLVVAVLRAGEQSADMRAARQQWAARKLPMLTVAVGGREKDGAMSAHGGTARVAIDRIDEGGVRAVVNALMAVVEPERRIGLARQFPAVRTKVFNTLIDETARANAGYAFTTGLAEIVPILDIPLNIGDMLVLTKNQLMMSYRIALASGKRGEPRELIGEILGVLGGGLLFRQIARQFVGLLPVIGIVPKVAVAYGGTWAIGRAVVLWATEGKKVSAARLQQLSREGMARGRDVARSIRNGNDF